jgi:Hemerythrin HHE cation binding domain
MAETISMNKVIHGAIRRDLQRFLAALAAFPDGDAKRAGQLGTAWDYFQGELDFHHRGEHEIAWPALRSVGVTDALLAEMDVEHERLADALGTAAEKMRALRRSPTRAAADEARAAISTLQTVTEEHLVHEERDVDPVYVTKKDTPELKAMARKFARRSPTAAGDFFAWLENGATTEERDGLRKSVPPPVVLIFSRVLGRRYRRTVAPVWS